ncbi:MAG: formylglycine-generating enzyme family protein [Bacteroidales bacterium]|jgi:formylglycine-generating enzyme required for sulfatase activity|nr:formylglycine-generating enzyme family protein [Bacteroidales bacterium]
MRNIKYDIIVMTIIFTGFISYAQDIINNALSIIVRSCICVFMRWHKSLFIFLFSSLIAAAPLAAQQNDIENMLEMVFVEGGTFTMGCTSEQGEDCQPYENPAHQVTLSDFYIGKYEVTEALWIKVMGKEWKRAFGTNNHVTPAYFYFSQRLIRKFFRKLNKMTGKEYRLPTEAEWEYAARGGKQSKGYKYSGSNDIKEVAWYFDNSQRSLHFIGQKKENELGIYDMSGNVGELCEDYYAPYSSLSQQDPVVLKAHTIYNTPVLRGGNIAVGSGECRVTARDVIRVKPNRGWEDMYLTRYGFRLAHSAEK